jgi:hypothetical protein
MCPPFFTLEGEREDLVTRRIMVSIRGKLLRKQFRPEGYQRKK